MRYWEQKRIRQIKQSLAVISIINIFLVYIAYINTTPNNTLWPHQPLGYSMFFVTLTALGYLCWFLIFGLKNYFGENPSVYSLALVFTLYLAIGAVVLTTGAYRSHAKILIIMPAAMMAVRYGKKFGMISAALGGAVLALSDFTFKNSAYNPYLERDLLLIFTVLILTWLIGDLVDTEKNIRKELEFLHTKLFKQYRFLRKIMETSFSGIMLLDGEMKIRLINPAAAEILGIAPGFRTGYPIKELNGAGELVAHIGTAMNSGLAFKNVELKVDVEGSIKQLIININPFSSRGKKFIVAAITDVTKLKYQEALIQQHEKLAAVAQMAAGFAHELKNPLTIVKGFSQLLCSKPLLDIDDMKYLKLILKEANRTNQLIEDFLNFANPKAPDREATDINELINSALVMVRTEMAKRKIKVKVRLKKVPLVYVDINQIKQVFVNIIENSIEAIDISGNIHISSLLCRDAKNGPCIKIIISDNGTGIPQHALKDLGMPFFTTKEGCMGLGLFTAYKIVAQHGGGITVRSREGKGTAFCVSIPV